MYNDGGDEVASPKKIADIVNSCFIEEIKSCYTGLIAEMKEHYFSANIKTLKIKIERLRFSYTDYLPFSC